MARILGKFSSRGAFLNAHYDWRSQRPFSRNSVSSSPVPDDFRPSLVPGSGSHPTLGVKQKHRQPAQLPVQLRLGRGVFCRLHYDRHPQHPFSAAIVLSSPVPDDFRPSLVPGPGSHPTSGVKRKRRRPAQPPAQFISETCISATAGCTSAFPSVNERHGQQSLPGREVRARRFRLRRHDSDERRLRSLRHPREPHHRAARHWR